MGQIGKVGSIVLPVTRNTGRGRLHSLDHKSERGSE